jgi:hypothetical protein
MFAGSFIAVDAPAALAPEGLWAAGLVVPEFAGLGVVWA